MNKSYSYECLNCNLEELSKIRAFLNKVLKKYIDNELTISHLILVVDEAITNLLEHSFSEKDNSLIIISLIFENNRLKIIISDNGKSFDLRDFVNIDMKEYFKSLKKGGLGIYIIKEIIDEIEYYPANSSQKLNKLILIKQI